MSIVVKVHVKPTSRTVQVPSFIGLPGGGNPAQILAKKTATSFDVEWVDPESASQGPQGIQGEKGETGEQGPAGPQGIPGPSGASIPFGSLTSEDFASKSTLALVQADGMPNFLQDSLWQKQCAVWLPMGINTSITTWGMTATSGGTATARSRNSSSRFLNARRLGYTSSATAGSVAFARDARPRATVGQGNSCGGFFASIKFGNSDPAPVANASVFAGLFKDLSPSLVTNMFQELNIIGVGCSAGDANLTMFARGATGLGHLIPLGPNFPANTANTDWYHLLLYSPSTQVNRIFYEIIRVGTAFVATGELIPAVYPQDSTTLGTCVARMNNTTPLAVAVDIGHMYLQVDE